MQVRGGDLPDPVWNLEVHSTLIWLPTLLSTAASFLSDRLTTARACTRTVIPVSTQGETGISQTQAVWLKSAVKLSKMKYQPGIRTIFEFFRLRFAIAIKIFYIASSRITAEMLHSLKKHKIVFCHRSMASLITAFVSVR